MQRLPSSEGKQLRCQLDARSTVSEIASTYRLRARGQIAPAEKSTAERMTVRRLLKSCATASQLANSFHLLGLSKRFLILSAFGNVDGSQRIAVTSPL